MKTTKTRKTKAAERPKPTRTTSRKARPRGEAVPMEILGDDIAPWDTYITVPAVPEMVAAPLTLHLDRPEAEPEVEAAPAAADAGGCAGAGEASGTTREGKEGRMTARVLCPLCAEWPAKRRSWISPLHRDWVSYLRRYTGPKWVASDADVEWLVAHARHAGHAALTGEVRS